MGSVVVVLRWGIVERIGFGVERRERGLLWRGSIDCGRL